MPDQSKFEKTLRLAKRYRELYGMSKDRAIRKARQEMKKRRSTHIIKK